MKKTFALTLILLNLVFLATVNSYAQTTPTPTINQKLLDEIASKTAQLNLVEKRGIVGKVTDSSDTQITLTDTNGNTRFIDVDELTKFYSSASTSFGISDVTKGSTLGVLGLYNKQTRRILAREVDALTPSPKVIYGAASAIDRTNFEITVIKENGQRIVAEVESITKTYSYSSGNIVKSGFSKIVVPESILIIGDPDKQDPNKILSSRIILFPDIKISPSINLSLPTSPTIIPSTGSGRKLTPIVH
jgi:hypothetical protein